MHELVQNIEDAYYSNIIRFVGMSMVTVVSLIYLLIYVIRKRREKKLKNSINAEKQVTKNKGTGKVHSVLNTKIPETYKAIYHETKEELVTLEEEKKRSKAAVRKPESKPRGKVEEPKTKYKSRSKPSIVKNQQDSPPKIKKSDPIPNEAIEPQSVEVKDLLKVTFDPPEDIRDTFPIVVFAKKGTIVRSHRYGTSKRRGYKEADFQSAIEQEFGGQYEVSGEIRLNTGSETRPFEPDIALIKNSKKNPIRIDIEVDEPYAGISRRATHCKGEDAQRDAYFKDRGWVVLRFTEKQVHQKIDLCLAFIAAVLNQLDVNYSIPDRLSLNYRKLKEQPWDIVQAQAWEIDHYREKYLNHDFEEIHDKPETVDRGFNEQEIAEEKLVKSSLLEQPEQDEKISFNAKNFHPRDSRIKFYPEPHIYKVDGIPFTAASNLIAKYFPKFDSYGKAKNLSKTHALYGEPVEAIVYQWERKGQLSAEKGTFLHTQIENYYLGKPYEKPKEFEYFKDFHKAHSNLIPYRSEWRIFDEEMQVAGTIDFIVKDGDYFDIYDWKRSQKVVNYQGAPITHNGYGNFGIGPLSIISDTSYNRYCIQQTIYKHILENNYGIKVRNMYLIVLHPAYEQYFKVEAIDKPEALKEMIKDL